MTDALLLGALAHLSGRVGLIDTTSLAGVEVHPRIGVVLGQVALVRCGCHHTDLALEEFPEREAATLGKEGGGRREGGGTPLLLEVQAELLEGRVDLEVRHWPLGKHRGDKRVTKNAMESAAENAMENAIGNGVERRKEKAKSVKRMEQAR